MLTVAQRIEGVFAVQCGTNGVVSKLLQNAAVTAAEWGVWCRTCGVLVNSTTVDMYAGCPAEKATLQTAMGSCLWGGETRVVATGACPTTTPTPPAVVTTPAPSTPATPSGSGSSTGRIEFSGPIMTVFIIGVCLIVCFVSSLIWFCYIRKTKEEKNTDEQLRNFNLLEFASKKKARRAAPVDESDAGSPYVAPVQPLSPIATASPLIKHADPDQDADAWSDRGSSRPMHHPRRDNPRVSFRAPQS